MNLLTASRARAANFSCEAWRDLPINATRDEIARGGFCHDVYRAPLERSFESALDDLLGYRVFAPERMHALVCTPDRRVAVGAIIVQRVLLGALAVETAVRVIEVTESPECTSFAYATLLGHAERGIAAFAISRAGGAAWFEAQAWSRAGHWLTFVGRPVARGLQRAITREAVASFSAARPARVTG